MPIAAAAGIAGSTHLCPEVSAHFMRVTETAHWLEWQDWADPILQEPFPVVTGPLLIPDRPGIDIEWDEDAVRRFAVRRSTSPATTGPLVAIDLNLPCACESLPCRRQ